MLDQAQPQAVIVFNGMFYPEAGGSFSGTATGYPVYTHEWHAAPLHFFTSGRHAYPIDIPETFTLHKEQDDYWMIIWRSAGQGNLPPLV